MTPSKSGHMSSVTSLMTSAVVPIVSEGFMAGSVALELSAIISQTLDCR